MSDAPTTDPTIPVDDPDAEPAWFDPDLPGSREYNEDEQALAKLLRPAEPEPPTPDPTEPLPDESQQEPGQDTPPEASETPAPDAPVGSPGAEGSQGGVPASTEPPPPVAGAVTQADEQYIDIGGRLYPKDQAAQILQLIDLGIAKVQETPLAPAPAVPETPTGPDVPAFNPEDYVDPELARATAAQIEALRVAQAPLLERLDALTAAEQRREQQAVQEQQAEANRAEQEAVTAVKAKFALNDDEFKKLYDKTAASGIVNGMIIANPGMAFKDVATSALETTYWSTEEFRTRDVQQQVAAQVADQLQSATVADKKSRAGSLAGGGGSVSRAPAPQKTASGGPRDPMAVALEGVADEAV